MEETFAKDRTEDGSLVTSILSSVTSGNSVNGIIPCSCTHSKATPILNPTTLQQITELSKQKLSEFVHQDISNHWEHLTPDAVLSEEEKVCVALKFVGYLCNSKSLKSDENYSSTTELIPALLELLFASRSFSLPHLNFDEEKTPVYQESLVATTAKSVWSQCSQQLSTLIPTKDNATFIDKLVQTLHSRILPEKKDATRIKVDR